MTIDGMEEGSSNKKHRRRKAPSPHYKGNNEGGFGNPPVRRQFTKKNPGGPGRPKGLTNLEAALRKRLGKKITVSRDGRSVKMTPFEVYAERIMEAVLSKSSSPAMLEYGYKLLTRFSSSEDEPVLDLSVFSDDELALYEGFLVRALGVEPANDDESLVGQQHNRTLAGLYRVTQGPDRHILVERLDDAT